MLSSYGAVGLEIVHVVIICSASPDPVLALLDDLVDDLALHPQWQPIRDFRSQAFWPQP